MTQDNEQIVKRALEINEQLKREAGEFMDFANGWQARYLQRQEERHERALEMARQEAASGVAAGGKTVDGTRNEGTDATR